MAGRLGAERPEVIVGPRIGYDAGIIRIGAGRVMAVTTDPLSLVPALGPEASARLACRLLASDAWTSGIPPAFATCSFHFPPDLPEPTLDAYLAAMHDEWKRLGVAVAAGHCEWAAARARIAIRPAACREPAPGRAGATRLQRDRTAGA